MIKLLVEGSEVTIDENIVSTSKDGKKWRKVLQAVVDSFKPDYTPNWDHSLAMYIKDSLKYLDIEIIDYAKFKGVPGRIY